MNTQTLAELSSDQKIDKVFHAFDISIPVGKEGRCLWPASFNREIAKHMRFRALSTGDVQKTCQISGKTAHSTAFPTSALRLVR